jgi:hypothetical protein
VLNNSKDEEKLSELIYDLYKLRGQFLVVGVCTTLSRCTLVCPTVDLVCPWSGKGDTPDISMWELSNIGGWNPVACA